jgi:hypothetical protein
VAEVRDGAIVVVLGVVGEAAQVERIDVARIETDRLGEVRDRVFVVALLIVGVAPQVERSRPPGGGFPVAEVDDHRAAGNRAVPVPLLLAIGSGLFDALRLRHRDGSQKCKKCGYECNDAIHLYLPRRQCGMLARSPEGAKRNPGLAVQIDRGLACKLGAGGSGVFRVPGIRGGAAEAVLADVAGGDDDPGGRPRQRHPRQRRIPRAAVAGGVTSMPNSLSGRRNR